MISKPRMRIWWFTPPTVTKLKKKKQDEWVEIGTQNIFFYLKKKYNNIQVYFAQFCSPSNSI